MTMLQAPDHFPKVIELMGFKCGMAQTVCLDHISEDGCTIAHALTLTMDGELLAIAG